MEYIILADHSYPDLEAKVRELIEMGWEPLGGVSITSELNVYTSASSGCVTSEVTFSCAQAMVKK